MIQFAIALLKIVNILLQKVYIAEGRRLEIVDELMRIHHRIGVTKEIVRQVELLSEDEVDSALRG